MLDPVQMTISTLLQYAPLTALVGANVYGGALPEHYDPTSNPALVVTPKGGLSHSEMPLLDVDVQVRVWCGINQFVLGRNVYFQVYNALHGVTNVNFGSNGRLVSCLESSTAQELDDEATGWTGLLASYKLICLQTDPFAPTDLITPTQTVAQYVTATESTLTIDGGTF